MGGELHLSAVKMNFQRLVCVQFLSLHLHEFATVGFPFSVLFLLCLVVTALWRIFCYFLCHYFWLLILSLPSVLLNLPFLHLQPNFLVKDVVYPHIVYVERDDNKNINWKDSSIIRSQTMDLEGLSNLFSLSFPFLINLRWIEFLSFLFWAILRENIGPRKLNSRICFHEVLFFLNQFEITLTTFSSLKCINIGSPLFCFGGCLRENLGPKNWTAEYVFMKFFLFQFETTLTTFFSLKCIKSGLSWPHTMLPLRFFSSSYA